MRYWTIFGLTISIMVFIYAFWRYEISGYPYYLLLMLISLMYVFYRLGRSR